MQYIVTWFFQENTDDSSYYPQVALLPTSTKFYQAYWETLLPFYTSGRLYNSEVKYLFITNSKSLPNWLYDFLHKNNISIHLLDLTFRTPKNWYTAWRNQFYVFDILKYLEKILTKEDSFIILDSDCIFLKNISPLFDLINENKCITYRMNFPNNQIENGISQLQMSNMYQEIYGEPKTIWYCGGEFIGMRVDFIPLVITNFDILWKDAFERFYKGLPKLNEEAHFLSIIYAHLNVDNNLAFGFIKRIWTALNFNNADKSDLNLSIWHLPAEKRKGFSKLSKFLCTATNITPTLFEKKVKLYMGVPKKTIQKWIQDHLFWLKTHLTK